MEEKHRTILRLNWCNIRDSLEPNNILPKLVLVLRETDEEEIRQQSTRQERCDKLLNILPTRGENAFNVFVNALVKEAPHLAKNLTKADMQTEGEIIKAREQSAKFRTKIRKLNAELDAEIDNHMKTLKELEKLKSLHGKENEGKEEEITPDGLQQKEIREGGDQRRLREMPGQSKNQTLEKEIQELKKSEDNQGERQPLQKKLQLVSWELEPANEEQPQQMGRPREMYKELDDKVTNETSELKELLAEIIQQHRADESCSRCATVRNERNSTITEIQTLRNEIQELKKEVRKISKDYQPNTQTPHKWHPSPQENPGHLSQEHKAVNVKKLQEEIKDLQKKNKKLEDLEKSKEKLEKDLLKSQKDLEKLKNYFACENERVKEYQQKLEKESKAKDDLLEQKLKDETQIKEENTSLQEKLKEEISKSVNLKKEVHRLRLTPNEMPGQIYSYSEDFDKRGVIYHLATMYGKTSQVNPSSTQIVVTRSSDREGHAEDLLKNQVKRGTVSGTKEKEGSSWCVDLTEKYVLYLTHYTLRHGRERSISVLLNWRLEGSLDGNRWKPLKTHKNDHGLKKDGSYCTCTWVIEGRSNAFRYFRIVQTGVNSSGRFGIFLSGIELYGVLIEKNS